MGILANVLFSAKYLKNIGETDHISERKVEAVYNKVIKSPSISDNSLAHLLSYIGTKTKVKFGGSCLKQDKHTFTHKNIVNIYTGYEINLYNYLYGSDPTLGNVLFGAVSIVKDADIDKNKYSKYGVGFSMNRTFRFPAIGSG